MTGSVVWLSAFAARPERLAELFGPCDFRSASATSWYGALPAWNWSRLTETERLETLHQLLGEITSGIRALYRALDDVEEPDFDTIHMALPKLGLLGWMTEQGMGVAGEPGKIVGSLETWLLPDGHALLED
jgi:hypothetical protein